jgi:ribosomal protein S18 acetylase RimI-like enzyme
MVSRKGKTGPFRARINAIIRLATPLDDLERLANEGGITGLSEERAREILESAIASGECLVHSDVDNEIDGFVITNARSFFGRDFVKLLVVSRAHRRSGIGSALLGAVMAGATSETIFASTNESNAAMRALFERGGWSLSGILTGIDEGDPELVYYRTLDPILPAD